MFSDCRMYKWITQKANGIRLTPLMHRKGKNFFYNSAIYIASPKEKNLYLSSTACL